MTDPIVPIREGILPEFGLEREMVDYCQSQLRRFKEGAGQPPTRIMIALAGKGADDKFHTRANSWDAKEETSRSENCGLAVILFTDRGIKDD